MGCTFWKFASTIEKGFHTPYDRDKDEVTCPECKSIIRGDKWDIVDYAYTTSDGYLVYRCPLCGEVLDVIELNK